MKDLHIIDTLNFGLILTEKSLFIFSLENPSTITEVDFLEEVKSLELERADIDVLYNRGIFTLTYITSDIFLRE